MPHEYTVIRADKDGKVVNDDPRPFVVLSVEAYWIDRGPITGDPVEITVEVDGRVVLTAAVPCDGSACEASARLRLTQPVGVDPGQAIRLSCSPQADDLRAEGERFIGTTEEMARELASLVAQAIAERHRS